MRRAFSLLVAVTLFAVPGGPNAEPKPRTAITVMTRNLYLGANLDRIRRARSFAEAAAAVADAWAQVQANDFRRRADAIVAEIARAKPDFVGLQELTLYRTQTPADFQLTRARQVVLDYKSELARRLRMRKLTYRFVGIDVNTDAELPSGNPPTMDIRLTLRNALLVKSGIRLRNVRAQNYASTFPVLGGLAIARRGWVSADAGVGGRTFRVITTHLEAFDRATQEAQSRELLAGPAKTRLPVILVGDLNSKPDGSSTASYANLIAGGFRDAWSEAYPGAAGLTCCHGDDLREPGGPFFERIDDVLVRGGFRALRGAVVGEAPAARTRGGLWPSDHGGLWMTLRLPRR